MSSATKKRAAVCVSTTSGVRTYQHVSVGNVAKNSANILGNPPNHAPVSGAPDEINFVDVDNALTVLPGSGEKALHSSNSHADVAAKVYC